MAGLRYRVNERPRKEPLSHHCETVRRDPAGCMPDTLILSLLAFQKCVYLE